MSITPRFIRRLASVAAAVLAAAAAHAAIPATYPTGSGVTIGYSNGQVTYGYDSKGDRIPDYSRSGYRGGDAPIPDPPATTTLNPTASGDDRARIQAAIDALASRPLDATGFRGVLKLNAGVYRLSSSLYVRASGIVIRGAGSGPSGTILRRTTGNGDAVIFENDGSLATEVSGTRHAITTSYVPVGATYFALDSVAGLSVGSTIMIHRTATEAWKNNLPEPETTRPASNYGVKWDRVITEIDGNRVRVDAPIMQAIDTRWGGGYVYRYTWPGRLANVGLEDVRCDAPGVDTDAQGETAGAVCKFSRTINGWVRRVWNEHMRGHVVLVDGSKWVTVQDITSYHNPVPSHSGPSIQIFSGSYSDSILYHHITARAGGFEFTAGRQHGGPIVFSESAVPTGFAASGPHMQGNAGMVFDNLRMDHGIAVEYQGKGWGGFNALIYNTEITHATRGFNVERPRTVHLWLMGCKGPINQGNMSAEPVEVVSHGTFLSPKSLFRAQLIDRVGATLAARVLGSTAIGNTDPGSSAPTPTPTPTPTTPPAVTPTPTATPADGLLELTPGAAGVTASTHDGNVPANTVDGNLATRWSSNGDGQWIRYDLGTSRTLAHVRIAFYSGNTRQTRFDLQVSGDGTAWTNVLTNVLSGGTTTQEETFDVPDPSGRYVRFLGHGNTVNSWNSVVEFRIFGYAAPAPTPTATPTPTAAPAFVEVTPPASGVSASTHDGNLPANSVDGSLDTRWSSNGDGHWLRFDLGAPRTLTHVAIAFYKGNERQSRFDLQVSTDGTVWTDVLTAGLSGGATTAEEVFDFTDRSARFLRYVGHGNTAATNASWNSVNELSLFANPDL